MTFEHYILTRFNLSFFEGVKKAPCSHEYLEYRFDLFEKYCMPSIMGQTCQNFKWLVLFDIHTPDEFKERIARYHSAYSNFIPCYLDTRKYVDIPSEYKSLCESYENTINTNFPSHPYKLTDEREMRWIMPLFLMDAIKGCSSRTPDFYVTTRIDNDDAFHKDMVKNIQQRIKNSPRKVVFDFVYTYKYILYKGIVYRYELQNGHFITLVEPSKDLFQSVLYGNHLFVDNFFPVEHIYQEPLQTELIHGKNVVNDFTEISDKGMLYALFHFRRSNFGYKKTYLSFIHWLHIFGSLIKQKIINHRHMLEKITQKVSSICNNFSAYRRRYLWPLPKFRQEAVVMIDGTQRHGGLTDRFRNILSVYSYCKEHHIPFKLYYDYPSPLQQILLPNKYDWRIKKGNLTYFICGYEEIYLWVDTCDGKYIKKSAIVNNNLHFAILDKLNKKKQYHIYGNSYFAKGHYFELFDELFKPSPYLAERLQQYSMNFSEPYEAVTLRFQQLLGDFEEGDYDILSDGERAQLIDKCMKKIKDLHETGYFPTNKILVTSDSPTFLRHVKALPYVYIIPGKMEHMDYTQNSDLEMNSKSFVDLFMLARAQRVTLLQTGKMYKSGFPEFAAEIGNKPFNKICF